MSLPVGIGLMQGPTINHLGWFARILNRHEARTIHSAELWWFLILIFIHITVVSIAGARANRNYLNAGKRTGHGQIG